MLKPDDNIYLYVDIYTYICIYKKYIDFIL